MNRLALRFTPNAELELDLIWDYVSRDGHERADRVIERIKAKCAKLCSMPGMGHPYPHWHPGVRLYSVWDYLVLYIYNEKEVRVLHVVHGARDIPVFLARLDE